MILIILGIIAYLYFGWCTFWAMLRDLYKITGNTSIGDVCISAMAAIILSAGIFCALRNDAYVHHPFRGKKLNLTSFFDNHVKKTLDKPERD